MYEYVKVILYAYPKLDEIAEATERSGENRAALSYRAPDDTYTIALSVAEEFFLAERIRALKKLVDEMISGLSREEKFLLEYKYFRRKKQLETGGNFSCSERSYFRRQDELFLRICVYFAGKGITEQTFCKQYGDFPCFMKLYGALRAGRESALAGKRRKRGVTFQSSARSSGD